MTSTVNQRRNQLIETALPPEVIRCDSAGSGSITAWGLTLIFWKFEIRVLQSPHGPRAPLSPYLMQKPFRKAGLQHFSEVSRNPGRSKQDGPLGRHDSRGAPASSAPDSP